MNKIVAYKECKCGAVTLFFEDGTTNSCKKRNLNRFGISLKGVKKEKEKNWCCNHCVNHYGIDICSCGSGKRYDKCCGTPMETLGTQYDGFSQILKNYAR